MLPLSSKPLSMTSSVTSSTTTSSSSWTTSGCSRRHHPHPSLVLQRLLENRLFAKAEFHRSTIQFFGFVVSKGKLEMDPSKTEAVMSWPTPIDRRELQRFLGFANFYRRFYRGFSSTITECQILITNHNKHKTQTKTRQDSEYESVRLKGLSSFMLHKIAGQRQNLLILRD